MAKLMQIQFKGDIKPLKKFLNVPRFKTLMERKIRAATRLNAMIMHAEIRRRIRGRKYARNAKVTLMIKGKKKPPLIRTGQLHAAIEQELINSYKARVGIRPGQNAKLAKILHEGATVKITPKVRAAIFGQIKEAGGNIDKLPKMKSKGVLRIPPRRFLTEVFENRKLRSEINRNWDNAVKGLIKKASGGRAPQ